LARLGVRLGLGPAYVFGLSPEDREFVIAWDWAEIELKRRAKIAADFAALAKAGAVIRRT
jgi:hypothetical protein